MVGGVAGGDGEVAGHEVEASVSAFVEDDFSLAVEDEEVAGFEVFGEPVTEDLDAVEKAGFWGEVGGGGWSCGWFRGRGEWWCGCGCGVWLGGSGVGVADEGGVEAWVGGGEFGGCDGAQELFGEMPDFRGVEPWIDGVHREGG